MMNQERNLTKMIFEICNENGIDCKSFSYDWIFELKKNDIRKYIQGYQFGLNTGSVQSLCSDKSALSEILLENNRSSKSNQIPCVEHFFFMSPIDQKYVSKDGNWAGMTKLLKDYGTVVCKPNGGSGGNNVYKCSNQFELEQAVYEIFSKTDRMAISPFYDIEDEFRIVYLNGKIMLIEKKERQFILGDGKKSIGKLISDYLSEHIQEKNNEISIEEHELNYIPVINEKIIINWKHNLGKGATGVILSENQVSIEIIELAKKVAKFLGIAFASIDIVKIRNKFRVLEINSGVMLEHLSKQNDNENYQTVKEIYKSAILSMF